MPAPTKTFLFDSLLSESDICNQKRERDAILSGVRSGLKLLIYGRRNYGKTSLVKNVVAKKWLEENPNGFYCYVDLMGVRSLTNISERMTVAFSEAYNCAFRLNALFQSLLGSLKQLKPTLELDDSGTPKLSLAMSPQNQPTHFVQILRHIGTLAEKVKIFLVFDEFQDIHDIDESEALLRDALQNLNADIPVIIMGSKEHLLTSIFAKPKAPFFNWGTHIAFQPIAYEDYHAYIQERFHSVHLTIGLAEATYLQDKLDRNPEAINRLCYAIQNRPWDHASISTADIDAALADLVASRRSEPERYLNHFSSTEQQVMIALAKSGPISHPQSKSFTSSLHITAAGIGKIIKRLENDAVIYLGPDGYVLADPLLKNHLLRYRL
jgi:hypothetical protein